MQRAMVVDLDVHQGNGTAAIFPPLGKDVVSGLSEHWPCGEIVGPGMPSRDGVFTLSLHQSKIYPAYKPPSSIDVHLVDGVEDREYLEVLRHVLAVALERFKPQLIVYVAGSDPYFDDKLGGLALTIDGLRARDRLVFQTALELQTPVVSVFAGGYARKLEDTVTIHANTVLAAAEVFSGKTELAAPFRSRSPQAGP
jgi:acetoin utilization deacetylase AcuC-like enzyme